MHISHWVKGEVYSLEALQSAYSQFLDTPNQKKKAIDQIKDTEETIEKLSAGRFTFGGMLKSDKEKKESIVIKQQLIDQLKEDVQNYDIIRRILIIYLATVAIPSY